MLLTSIYTWHWSNSGLGSVYSHARICRWTAPSSPMCVVPNVCTVLIIFEYFSCSPAGVDGTILEVNPAFASMLGYGTDQRHKLIGRTLFSLTTPQDIQVKQTTLRMCVRPRMCVRKCQLNLLHTYFTSCVCAYVIYILKSQRNKGILVKKRKIITRKKNNLKTV